jgi:hypothetical protein
LTTASFGSIEPDHSPTGKVVTIWRICTGS